VERLARRSRPYHRHRDTTCYPQVLIAVFLSREFKHDETNRAWWTGRWYGRGLGSHAMSQPAREFVVKTIELSLWSSDLLLGHFLLFMMTPPILIPYVDRFHATLLCKWFFPLRGDIIFNLLLSLLRPSKQIRAPLFSIRQKRNRRWIVSCIPQHSSCLLTCCPDRKIRDDLHSDDHFIRGFGCFT